eukprot:11518202-Prorocentrum_lima.AAC.1
MADKKPAQTNQGDKSLGGVKGSSTETSPSGIRDVGERLGTEDARRSDIMDGALVQDALSYAVGSA